MPRRRYRFGGWLGVLVVAVLPFLAPGTARADPLDRLMERLERLEEESRRLRKEIEALEGERTKGEERVAKGTAPELATSPARLVRFDRKFGSEILDPTTDINRKARLILERRKDGTLAAGGVHLHGSVTAIADYQKSNRADKFGYLMRHPTGKNQVGDTVSEATIHSAQLGVTGTLGDWLTGHVALLFDPEQSFGAGTNTSIERNQVQVRHAYALFGDLERSSFYASVGKQAVAFGLTDTVNPFTASPVWHAFGVLANSVIVGYAGEKVGVAVTGIQGGAQFRAANAPVEGTTVPSRLNNFALDAHFSSPLGPGTLLLGASYLHGSAYCQDFPVEHFVACRDNNPAFDVYGKLVVGDFTFKGEFARTTDEWPGTFNPAIPEFAASPVTGFDVGAKYRLGSGRRSVDVSAEFGRFEAGPHRAPWERQDQIVLGAAWFARPSAKLFAEYVRIDGYTPLNFISGGSILDERGETIPDRTHSDRSARADVFLIGATLAF